jgi:thiamine biosynthesis lipoprotein
VTVPGTASPHVRVEHLMGMPIVVDIRDDVAVDLPEEVFAWFRLVDATFSTYLAHSEISRLNRGDLHIEDAHPDVREVLRRCDELRDLTRGYFDMRAGVHEGVDPSGLVKGWSVDRASLILDRAGVRNYAISAGGDMVLRGGALPEPCWRVGVQHPLRRDRVAAVLAGQELAVATSGAYARGDHVVDPYTGAAPTGVLSVTVCGPELATADALATAAFAMGRAGPHWTARLPRGYEAMTILADGTVLSTSRFPSVGG